MTATFKFTPDEVRAIFEEYLLQNDIMYSSHRVCKITVEAETDIAPGLDVGIEESE